MEAKSTSRAGRADQSSAGSRRATVARSQPPGSAGTRNHPEAEETRSAPWDEGWRNTRIGISCSRAKARAVVALDDRKDRWPVKTHCRDRSVTPRRRARARTPPAAWIISGQMPRARDGRPVLTGSPYGRSRRFESSQPLAGSFAWSVPMKAGRSRVPVPKRAMTQPARVQRQTPGVSVGHEGEAQPGHWGPGASWTRPGNE